MLLNWPLELFDDGNCVSKLLRKTPLHTRQEEAQPGFEPGNNGFAIRRLRPLGYCATTCGIDRKEKSLTFDNLRIFSEELTTGKISNFVKVGMTLILGSWRVS